MPSRASFVTVLIAVLSLGLLAFLLFAPTTKRSAHPPTSSSVHSSKRPSLPWNGYSPHVRYSQNDKNEPASSSPSLLSRFFTWVSKPFFRPFSRDAIPTLPQTFRNATVAGVPVAFHNPFSPSELNGVALLLHACRQSATDWFVLPEHRRLASELLRHHLALLAVTSANRVTGCWSTRHPASLNFDASRVRLAIRQWLDAQRIAHAAPTYAVGVSSGATFLSVIAAAQIVPSLASQALYLSAGNPRALRNASELYPNTLFVRLQADRHYAPASVVAASRTILLSRRVPLVAEMPLLPERWTPMSLHIHEPRVSAAASDAIFHHLASCAYKIDCAASRAAVHNTSVALVWQQPELRVALSQVARVLRGDHELSASHANLVADWLVRHGRLPSQSPHGKQSRRRFR